MQYRFTQTILHSPYLQRSRRNHRYKPGYLGQIQTKGENENVQTNETTTDAEGGNGPEHLEGNVVQWNSYPPRRNDTRRSGQETLGKRQRVSGQVQQASGGLRPEYRLIEFGGDDSAVVECC